MALWGIASQSALKEREMDLGEGERERKGIEKDIHRNDERDKRDFCKGISEDNAVTSWGSGAEKSGEVSISCFELAKNSRRGNRFA